jgi:hypothetical protein
LGAVSGKAKLNTHSMAANEQRERPTWTRGLKKTDLNKAVFLMVLIQEIGLVSPGISMAAGSLTKAMIIMPEDISLDFNAKMMAQFAVSDQPQAVFMPESRAARVPCDSFLPSRLQLSSGTNRLFPR